MSDGKRIINDECRDEMDEETEMLLRKLNSWFLEPEDDCPGPYHVLTDNEQCFWSCGTGTQPDNSSNECVCQPGYYETGTDSFGRRTCSQFTFTQRS